MNALSIAMAVFTLIGTCLLGVSVVPQVFYTVKTKKTAKLSLMLYLVLTIGTFFMLIYGIGLTVIPDTGIIVGNLPPISHEVWLWSYRIPGILIIICEVICCSSSFIVSFIKVRNMIKAKKLNLTEEEYENNHCQGEKK